MNRLAPAVLLFALCVASGDSLARGGFSSSGGRGGFSSSRSFSSPSRSYSTPRAVTRTTTTTTTSRVTSGAGRYYGGGYWGHPMMYGGFGMGYGYSNGLVTGLILGHLMHPQGTTVYTGGGYSGQALLYPDGRVVDQNGYQVGTYANGQFSPHAGGMVAQPAPSAPPPAEAPQPVVIEQDRTLENVLGVVAIALLIAFIVAIL